jgi:uncharacterized membrane-anchored protein YjiN (DUF445 family)
MNASLEIVRAAQLRRMRGVATGLLVLMALVFVATSLFVDRFPWLAYARAFSEAAVVGACADWFAVTALFRHPLGLPIPHTGIVPRNKQRIGEELGAFIADNFLTVDVLEAKLAQFEVGRWGALWLRDPRNAESLARRATSLIPELLEMIPFESRRDFFAAAAASVVRTIPAAPLAANLVRTVWNEGRAQGLLDRGLEFVAAQVKEHEALIRSQVKGRTFRWLPDWVDRRIADKVVQALAEIVEEMRSPDHPWRAELKTAIDAYVVRLETDPELRRRGEALKRMVLEDPRLPDQLAQIWTSAAARLRASDVEHINAALAGALASFGEWLDEDAGARETLNAWARLAVRRVIAPRRHEIGRFVAGVVAGWDTRSIVEKLELQVGKDLQYIRVNGTVVGGLVGLGLYAAARALGLA